MGLCKCPKRRVTNQFCFEHRVNVCEYCMVANHPKCIIQSYLQWLQDSDYNPICEICTKSLVDDECIRLTCYHVFHWSCAEARFRALPRTTAPAGYQCPTCNTPVFPPPNLVSPVADVLKERLAGVNWARAGLGLPLLSEDQDLQGASSRRSISPNAYYMNGLNESRASPVGASDDESTNERKHSIVNIGDDQGNLFDNMSTKRSDLQNHSRKHKSLDLGANSFDHDDNKYKQKSAFSFLNRWWNNRLPPARLSRPGSVIRRYWLLILVVITVAGILYLLSIREVEDTSPFGNNGIGNQRILQKN